MPAYAFSSYIKLFLVYNITYYFNLLVLTVIKEIKALINNKNNSWFNKQFSKPLLLTNFKNSALTIFIYFIAYKAFFIIK